MSITCVDTRQNGQKYWRPDDMLGLGVAQVYAEGVTVETERPKFTDLHTGKTKVYIEGELRSPSVLVFPKASFSAVATTPVSLDPVYWELHIKVPEEALLGREDEDEPFQCKNKDAGGFAYYFLRIGDPRQKGVFKPVYMRFAGRGFKISVREQRDAIEVAIVYLRLSSLPGCLHPNRNNRRQ